MDIQRLDKFKLPKGFRGRPGLVVQLWWLVDSTLFRMSPQFMYGWRRFLLRLFGAKVGRGVIVRPTAKVTYPWKITIGDYAWIGDNVALYSLGEIEIGEHSVISQRSYICTGGHDHQKPSFDIFAKKIVIEPMAWVATDVYVAPGVRIGRGAVIGARSSVFEDMPPMMISIGNPAQPVKRRVLD